MTLLWRPGARGFILRSETSTERGYTNPSTKATGRMSATPDRSMSAPWFHSPMITPVTQRWRDRRAYYRLAGITGDAFQSRFHEVAEIADDTTAEQFIKQHHY